MTLAIEYRDIEALIPYARNSRTHSAEQVAQIAASIREFGFTNPILVDDEGGIIAGHGRVMAARKLGLDAVPTITLSGLSDTQRRAYVIADNRMALSAGWDEDMLRIELESLDAIGFDLSLTGFSDAELDDLLSSISDSDPQDGEADADTMPDEGDGEPVTRPGDVWILGRHRVMCGDSTKPYDVAELMDGEIAKLLHADPPYGMGKEADGVANDNLYGADLDRFQMAWWRAFRPHITDGGSAYIWGNAPELWRLWYCGGLADSERLSLRNEIVWNKGSANGMASSVHRMYATATERCLFVMFGAQDNNKNAAEYWDGWEPIRAYIADEMKRAGWTAADLGRITGTGMGGHWIGRSQWQMIAADQYDKLQAAAAGRAFVDDYELLRSWYDKTRATFNNTHDAMTDAWEFPRVVGEDRHGHATPKPVAMMERIMLTSLDDGEICAEPFGGSGSTLIAAERTGRACFTMEISPKYCDTIIKRWQMLTGGSAEDANGTSFDKRRAAQCQS